MLLTNVKADFRKVLIDENTTQRGIAEKMGCLPQYISQIVNRSPVDEKLVQILDMLGYDVEYKIVKKHNT